MHEPFHQLAYWKKGSRTTKMGPIFAFYLQSTCFVSEKAIFFYWGECVFERTHTKTTVS